MSKPINLLIVDDHPIFRNGLAGLLKGQSRIGTIHLAANGYEAIAITEKQPLDIILMDIQMPKMDGFEATKIIHKAYPEIRILALSMRDDHSSIIEICAYGACGYLFKNTDLDEILIALETVMSGDKYFQREISKIMVDGFVENTTGIMPFQLREAITGQERIILEHLCSGLKADEIGLKMKMSKRTVEAIKGKLYLKTGTTNVGNLIGFAYKNKIIQ